MPRDASALWEPVPAGESAHCLPLLSSPAAAVASDSAGRSCFAPDFGTDQTARCGGRCACAEHVTLTACRHGVLYFNEMHSFNPPITRARYARLSVRGQARRPDRELHARSLRVGHPPRQCRRLGPCGGFLRALGSNEHPLQSLKPHECLTFEWAGRRHDRSDVVEEGARAAHFAESGGSRHHGVLHIESQEGGVLAHKPFCIADGPLVECSESTEMPERNAGTLISGCFGGEYEQQSPEGGGFRRCLNDLPAQSGTACFTIGFALHPLLPLSR